MGTDQKMPAKMTAIAISQPGGPLVLKPEERRVPVPIEAEILIRRRPAPPTCPASKWRARLPPSAQTPRAGGWVTRSAR